jgi:hypothetical protein
MPSRPPLGKLLHSDPVTSCSSVKTRAWSSPAQREAETAAFVKMMKKAIRETCDRVIYLKVGAKLAQALRIYSNFLKPVEAYCSAIQAIIIDFHEMVSRLNRSAVTVNNAYINMGKLHADSQAHAATARALLDEDLRTIDTLMEVLGDMSWNEMPSANR